MELQERHMEADCVLLCDRVFLHDPQVITEILQQVHSASFHTNSKHKPQCKDLQAEACPALLLAHGVILPYTQLLDK